MAARAPRVFRMRAKEMAMLCTSLSYMISAGMTVSDGVEILMSSSAKRKSSRLGLQVLRDGLDEGWTLSEVFRNRENVFGRGLWRQLDAAERTGKVPECLLRMASQFNNQDTIKGKIAGALIYPLFVLVIGIVVSYFLFTTTVPQINEMLIQFGGEIPPATKIALAICEAFTEHLQLVIVTTCAVVVSSAYLIARPLRKHWDHLMVVLPVIKHVTISSNYSRVYTLVNDMIANGAPNVEALRVAAAAVANRYINTELTRCADVMEREGLALWEALCQASTMPEDDKLMVHVGSRTGRQLDVLRDLAVRRFDAANLAVSQALDMLNPIIMVFVCLLIGFLVMAVYEPTLDLTTSIG